MRPSLRQLEYAVALAESLHFGRAARACHVSQPALSLQIRSLEDALGVRIFERSRRRVLLTSTGERVVVQARRVLRELDELLDLARHEGPFARELRLGVIPSIGPYLLPVLLGALRRAQPQLELLLHELPAAAALRALDEGLLDLLLTALPAGGPLERMSIFSEPLVVLARAEHPLMRPTTRRKRVRVEDLRETEILLLDEGHPLREQGLEICARAGAREVERVRGSSVHTLVQMVANGIGIGLLPASTAAIELRACPDLASKPFAPPVPLREIGLVWRSGSARADEYRLLGQIFRDRLRGDRLPDESA